MNDRASLPLARRYNGDPIGVYGDKPRRAPHKIKKIRHQRWPEVFDRIDPDKLAATPPPPDHVLRAFQDVFGGRDGLKLSFHPHFKRLCMMQRIEDPSTGSACWAIVSVFQESPQPGWLPPDLDVSDKRYEVLRGMIGAFREPTKKDFELIAKVDPRRKQEEIVAALDEHEAQETKDYERTMFDHNVDAIEYRFNEIKDGANQDAGSGQHMRSPPLGLAPSQHGPQDTLKKRVLVVNGTRTVVPRGSRIEAEYERDLAESAARELAKQDPNAEVLGRIKQESEDAKLQARIEKYLLQKAAHDATLGSERKRPKTL
jgi:hypothetical protein